MRILYVAPKYDYGEPSRGHSFEHNNFFDCLWRMGHDIVYFDSLTLVKRLGRPEMNVRLSEVVAAEKPDLLFSVLYYDEFDRDVVRKISSRAGTTTLNWFCDDHVRFATYSRHWAPCFNWVVTTAASAVAQYRSAGCGNVIESQWACNPFLYRKLLLPLEHDVTFVGQAHGRRPAMIQSLRRAGIDVKTWGRGWERGRLSHGQMVEVFNSSRVNLNFVDFSDPIPSPALRARQTFRRWAGRTMDWVPGSERIKHLMRRGRSGAGSEGAPDASAVVDVEDREPTGVRYVAQIKGRNFEVPACGGFTLTGMAENLGDYYRDGEEVVCFRSTADLVTKVRYYLEHEERRAAIAHRGYQRTHGEHTYAHRFSKIFGRIGLPAADPEELLTRPPSPGSILEVA